MITRIAVQNYRSIHNLKVSLGSLNVVTGPNGSGKSNLYRSLRLLAHTAQGGIVPSLAEEGGLHSTFWAGPEEVSARMKRGEVPVEGALRKGPVRLKLGFSDEEYGYSISLGLPVPSRSVFSRDPEVKREYIWVGPQYRKSAVLVERRGLLLRSRTESGWEEVSNDLNLFESMFSQIADPFTTPLVMIMRERIRQWRFYDHFRTDRDAPSRLPQLATRTVSLSNDGRDLAAALQTIREMGDEEKLQRAIHEAFPGARLNIRSFEDGRFSIEFSEDGLLRPLTAAELSEGTLRYILWTAALLTPRPPALMVLNEPEASLHPDLIPALASLIKEASRRSQVWVVSHSVALTRALSEVSECQLIELEKIFGETQVSGQDLLSTPQWGWPGE